MYVHRGDMNILIELHQNARVLMTRDMELIRQILLKIKARQTLNLEPIEIDGYDRAIVMRHLEMLENEHLIEGIVKYSGQDGLPSLISVKDMSWDGHNFIAVLENKSVWNTMKEKFSPSELAGMPLSIVKEIGLALLKQAALKAAGL